MKRLRTLRVRFALWVAGLLLVVLAAFGAYVYFSLARGLADSIDRSLDLNAAQALTMINVKNGKISYSGSIAKSNRTAAKLRQKGLTLRILDPGGQVIQALNLYHRLPIVDESLAAARRQHATYATVTDPVEGDPVRIYTVPVIEQGKVIGIVQAIYSLDAVEDTLERLLTALLIGGSLLALVATFGGNILAAHALAPIDHIIRTARRISAEDLSARLNLPATDDEVGRLAATFDEMLTRLNESFKRERQFSADATHELRTPLAAMQAILSVTGERRRTPEDYEQALADLTEETNRLRSLVEDLLCLARWDNQLPIPRESVDLSALLGDITDSLRPLAEAKGLILTCDTPNGITLYGDSDGLIRLFVNLVDNAIKYTKQGVISLTAHVNSNNLYVTISDTGDGIPAEHLPRIFDRFYRLDTSRSSPGAGLGLAIVQDIARAHGGAIEVSSTVGKGSSFTVSLPR